MTAKAKIDHLPHHLLVPGTAGGPVGRAGSELKRRNVASVFLVCLMFKLREGESVSEGRKGGGKKSAYVVRREPEAENVINP